MIRRVAIISLGLVCSTAACQPDGTGYIKIEAPPRYRIKLDSQFIGEARGRPLVIKHAAGAADMEFEGQMVVRCKVNIRKDRVTSVSLSLYGTACQIRS